MTGGQGNCVFKLDSARPQKTCAALQWCPSTSTYWLVFILLSHVVIKTELHCKASCTHEVCTRFTDVWLTSTTRVTPSGLHHRSTLPRRGFNHIYSTIRDLLFPCGWFIFHLLLLAASIATICMKEKNWKKMVATAANPHGNVGQQWRLFEKGILWPNYENLVYIANENMLCECES